MPAPRLRDALINTACTSVVALLLLLLPCPAAAEFVGGIVVPHGDFALAPELLPEGSSNRCARAWLAFFARWQCKQRAAIMPESWWV